MTDPLNKKLNKEENDEVNLNFLLNIFKRNWKFITLFASSFTVFSILYSYMVKPIYKGGFEIIVESNSSKSFDKSGNPLNDLIVRGSVPFSSANLETEKFILQSPFVLQPVFNYAKNKDINLKSVEKLTFKSWRKKFLKINYQDGTNILSISFRNKNKEFILDVLNMVLNKYKAYSKSDRERELQKTINFLSQQSLIYKDKAALSRKELNLFTIENGLGDIDGFIEIGKSKIPQYLRNNINLKYDDFNPLLSNSLDLVQDTSGAAQRYKSQFRLLEAYETEYANISSKLKPSSKYIKDLEIKIKNLKSSLKRPNEILLKLRDLKNEADRYESVYNDISNQLVVYQLEKVKQLDPWRMISKPTIDDQVVFPKKRNIVTSVFLLSSILAYLFSTLKEKKSGKIFELEHIKLLLESNYLNTIFFNNIDINNKLIRSIIGNENQVGLIQLDLINNSGENYFNKIFSVNDKFLNSVNIIDEEQMLRFSKYVLLVCEGKCKKSQIQMINNFMKIYKDKIVGWFYVKDLM